MATILGLANGNWSASGTWTSGIIPGSGDIVVANGKTITVNVNSACIEFRNDTTGGAVAGGILNLADNVIFSGNIIANGANGAIMAYTSTLGNSSTIVGNLLSINSLSSNNSFAAGGPGTLNIFGSLSGSIAGAGYIFFSNNIANLNIVGSLINTSAGNISYHLLCTYTSGNMSIVGNIVGGAGPSAQGLQINSAMNNVIISGNITGGSSNTGGYGGANAIVVNNSVNNMRIVGNLYGGTTSASVIDSNAALRINVLSYPINISGSVFGGFGNFQTTSILNFTNTNIIIVGNVIGGGTTSYGINNAAAGTITVVGSAIGGTITPAIYNASLGTVIVSGTAIGGSGAAGVYNLSTGSVYATLAKGNGYGIGSSGVTYQVGLYNNSIGNCYVSGLEFGDLGASPVYGPVQFLNNPNNTCSIYRPSGLSKKVLVDITNVSGLLPITANVRKNITYNLGNNIGSLSMPSSGSVAFGVPVDNTTGIALLSSASQIWDYPSANITGVNSIGNRLKNCSTVENLGQQLANILSSMNS